MPPTEPKIVEPAKGAAGAPAGTPAGEPAERTFTQADVNRIVEDRLGRDRAKYDDYDELQKKVTDYEKQQEQTSQKDLESKHDYDTLKKGWAETEAQLQQQLTNSKLEVQTERVSNALTNEILKQNAYPDAVQLLRSATTYNEDGTITIKGKDANGIDGNLSIEQGVASFLKDRPYLVKGSAQGGAGTQASNVGGGVGGAGQQQENLSEVLQNAMAVGDRKLINETKIKIRAKHALQGIVSIL